MINKQTPNYFQTPRNGGLDEGFMKKYDTKIIKSGSTLEIIKFGSAVVSDSDIHVRFSPSGRSGDAAEEDKLVNRHTVMKRARSDLRRLIQANNKQWKDTKGMTYKPVFLTLTFADNIQDFETANHEFKLFMMRLGNKAYNRNNQNCLKYVVVPEFQKRGAIHYHLVLFNLPYLPSKSIAECWGNGFIKIKAIDQVDNVGAYVCKYMGKDLDDDRLRGKKCYFSSRGLFKPEETTYDTSQQWQKKLLETVIKTAQANTVKAPYEVSYPSEYYDTIVYTQYTLKC